MLPQNEFSSLTVSESIASHDQILDTQDPSWTSFSERRICTLAAQMYTPMNHIPHVVYEMLKAREASIALRADAIDMTDVMDSDSGQSFTGENSMLDEYEAGRNQSLSPPKRYYRTFWVSLARRTTQQAREIMIYRIKAGSCK